MGIENLPLSHTGIATRRVLKAGISACSRCGVGVVRLAAARLASSHLDVATVVAD